MLTFKRISKSRGIFLLTIALFALWAPTVFAGISLCIGKDGHVALESPAADCCAKQGNGSPAFQGDPVGECTVCLDVQLACEAETVVPQHSLPSTLGLLPIAWAALLPAPVVVAPLTGAQPPVRPFLATLRTTRLLI